MFGGGHIFSERNELGVADQVAPTDFNSVKNGPIVGARFGILFSDWVGVEGEVGYLMTGSRNMDDPQRDDVAVSALTYRAHFIVELWTKPMQKAIPFLLFGGGATTVLSTDDENVISKDTDEMAYLGIGLKIKNDSGLGIRLDVKALFPPSSETIFATMDFEGTIGLFKEFGVRTRPEKVEPEPEPEPTPDDADGDGLLDPDDGCPQDPEDFDSFEDENGCPDPDNDGDGVLDGPDDCDDAREDMDQYADDDGCPDPDNDGDGILDDNDSCKMEAEDFDQFQDEDGCPDPDNDGDGVLDGSDQCPDKLETANGYEDSDGCPDDVPKAVQQFTGVIKGINFKTDSAEILKSSNKVLNKAVKVLQDYPDLRMEIQGHTDDQGERDYNLDLSQRRADAVKDYFVAAGIDAGRLEAKGYGPDAPVVNKKTKAARAKNRRVEFKLISTVGASTDTPE